MQPIAVILLSLLVGSLLSIYLPMNSMVSKHLGSAITANITFFLMALVTSVALFCRMGRQRNPGAAQIGTGLPLPDRIRQRLYRSGHHLSHSAPRRETFFSS